MSEKKNMCKRGYEFYCTFGEEPNCKYGKYASVGECDYKGEDRATCTCKEARDEAQIKPKRKPLPDGTLPLTEREVMEFEKLVEEPDIEKVKLDGVGGVEYFVKSEYKHTLGLGTHRTVYEIEVILWLAERFDLIKED